MRKALAALALALAVSGCSGHSTATSNSTSTRRAADRHASTRLLVSPLGLARPRSAVVPGYVLIADRNNNRVLLVSPSKHVVWQDASLRGPDDAFFTPGYRSVITNEEFNDTLVELSLKTHARVWQYGHGGVAGSSPGYLNTPDDAYRLPSGITTVADIQNCRIVQVDRVGPGAARARRQLRARPAARLREPQRRHAAARRRPAGDGDRRLDRPPPRRRQPRLVDPLAGAVPLGRAAASGRPRARGFVRDPRQDRDRRPQRARDAGRSARRAGRTGWRSRRSPCVGRTA